MTATPTAVPVFEPACGPIKGWLDQDHGVLRATGIRYATASRFAPPEPAAGHTEVFEATQWSPACPQAATEFLDQVVGPSLATLRRDENCQCLSITMPTDVRADELLPVMVWIHGGSYAYFAGDAPIMDPAPLVREQRVIVVTVTYRLGLFGFLRMGPDHPANLGLLDQIEAFRWVRRNIAAFGGDPDNVTAFGQSAGGDAIAHLMATPGVRDLFARAIIQSAPLGIATGREAMTAAMAEAADGISVDTPTQEVVDRHTAVLKAAQPFGLTAAMPFGTQYGHDPLPAEDAVEAAWAAVAPDIDVLIGYTAEEARLFIPRMERVNRLVSLPLVGPVIRRVLVGVITDKAYAKASKEFAQRHARAGGRAYTYVVTWSAPGNAFGAAHTIDLPLLFGDEEVWRDAELVAGATWEEITGHATQVRRLWADFARGRALPDRGSIPGVLEYRRA